MILLAAARPPLQSFWEGPSTVFWVAVVECTVVIKPSTIPKLSLITLANGAKQLVVQEAFETTRISLEYLSSFTPMTNMGASFEGALTTTFLAPPLKWAEAFSISLKTPVDSTMYSAPQEFQGISAGFLKAKTLICLPLTTSLSPSTATEP